MFKTTGPAKNSRVLKNSYVILVLLLAFFLLIAVLMTGCIPLPEPAMPGEAVNPGLLGSSGNPKSKAPPANSYTGTTIYRAFPNIWSQIPNDERDLLSEIKLFPFNWSLTKYLKCDGALLPISRYSALFPLLGTKFGGDGKTNYALPSLTQKTPLNGLNYYICTNGPWPAQRTDPPGGELQYCPQESRNMSGDYYWGEILLVKNVSEEDSDWIIPCDGRTLPVNQNDALFALVGSAFGGNGTTTFALPNLSAKKSPVEGATYYIVTMGIFPERGSNDGTPPETPDLYQVIKIVFADGRLTLWPLDKELPLGYEKTGVTGTREECLDYIKEHSPQN